MSGAIEMYNQKQNIFEQFKDVKNYFSPKIIGEVNDVYVKIAKIKGQDVPWHTHSHEDELFYVLKGSLIMEVKDKKPEALNEGDLYIVKSGVEHRVHTEQECLLMLVENKGTKHTGEVKSEITKAIDEQYY